MSGKSPPFEVRQQLRQEAGFGCCRCGHPFIVYHHIIPTAEEVHMRPEDMMAVCPNCHDLFGPNDNPAISRKEQYELKHNPKNIKENQAIGWLYTNSKKLIVKLAGGVAYETPNLIEVLGGPTLLSIYRSECGRIEISAIIHDENGQEMACISRNQWFAKPSEVWDFEAKKKFATVRTASHKIAFQVDCREEEIKVQGNWFLNGIPIRFDPSQLRVGKHILRNGFVANRACFLQISPHAFSL